MATVTPSNKIVPHLWFADKAVEAANFYVSLFADSRGWLKDRYGVSWQISPTVLGEMMKDPDRARAGRVMETMLQMKKLDIARLEQAYATRKTARGEERHGHVGR